MSLAFPFLPRRAALLLAGAAALALVGCAAPRPATPEAAVATRAQARWQVLIKGDFAQAWQYATPAYKAIHPAAQYMSARGTAAVWKSAEVLSVHCPEADKCVAKVKLDSILPAMPKSLREVSTVLDETWLLQDGQWWYFEKL